MLRWPLRRLLAWRPLSARPSRLWHHRLADVLLVHRADLARMADVGGKLVLAGPQYANSSSTTRQKPPFARPFEPAWASM
jgi:hypothetical protein